MKEYKGTGEGWKRNRGKMPGTIDGTTLVETRRRSGMKHIGQAMNLHWTMNGGQGDIMAWRFPVEDLNKQAAEQAREIAQGKAPKWGFCFRTCTQRKATKEKAASARRNHI